MNQSENAIYVNLLHHIAAMYDINAQVDTLKMDRDTILCRIVAAEPARIIEAAAIAGMFGAKFYQIDRHNYGVYWPHPVFSDELYATYGEGVDPN